MIEFENSVSPDNTANVQSWTAGQVVDFTFDVHAPHTGYTNLSIVNTTTNKIIGEQLLYYADLADNAKTIPTNETSFSITILSDLGDSFSTAGACVVQHCWNAASIDQTYESCVDFVVGESASSAFVSSVLASSTSVSGAVVSTPASTTNAVTSASAIPTTLQTVTASLSTVSSSTETAAVASSTQEDDEDTC